MADIKSITLSPLEIQLDAENPRFIVPPNSDQASLRKYLLDFEEVISLVKSIISYGGLMPGERVIVFKENNSYIVLEGNRRICACQVILDEKLIPKGFRDTFPQVPQAVVDGIKTINVDIVKSRDITTHILAARHIDGARKWAPISKQKFCVKQWEAGRDIDQIYDATLIKKSDIKTILQNYYLLKYALDLPVWTAEDKGKLDIRIIKPNPYLRIFNTPNAKDQLKLKIDDKLNISTELSLDVFNKAIEHIARGALITKTINTRTNFDDIPGIDEILGPIGCNNNEKPPDKTDISPSDNPTSKIEVKDLTQGNNNTDETDLGNKEEDGDVQSDPDKSKTSNLDKYNINKTTTKIPRIDRFFEDLSISIRTDDPNAKGLFSIAKEIKEINYRNFPNAAAMLLRTLLEQSLKYQYLMIKGKPIKDSKDKDPLLSKILSIYSQYKKDLIPDPTQQRVFDSIFPTPVGMTGIKNIFDLILHHTNITQATPELLLAISKAGLFGFIQYLLNYNHS